MMPCDTAGGAALAVPGESVPSAIGIETAARDALKSYLRIATDAEDATLARLLAVAIGHGEMVTGRLFVAREVTETIAIDPAWRRLRWGPVRAITPPLAVASDGTAGALDPADYALDIDAAGDGWLRGGGMGQWRIGYTAGIAASWAALPDPLQQGAIRLAAHLFTHRDDAGEGAPPAAVAALWRPWRRLRLA